MTVRLHYMLDENHNIITTDNVIEWAQWFEENNAKRIVQQDPIDDLWISTVFMGIDHGFTNGGMPILFETMVFDKNHDEIDMVRYATWDEALQGHKDTVRRYQTHPEIEALHELQREVENHGQ